jgi:hypothetical protein
MQNKISYVDVFNSNYVYTPIAFLANALDKVICACVFQAFLQLLSILSMLQKEMGHAI